MDVTELMARLEIQEVLFRYCRGVDRGDKALIASVYHEGAVDRHGPWEGQGKAFGDYLVPAMDAVPLIGQHHITNCLIEFRGDQADVESYFIAFHPEKTEAGPGHALVCGRYLDRFARRGGEWLIEDREVVIDVARSLDPTAEWGGAAYFKRGARRDLDPSFDHKAHEAAR